MIKERLVFFDILKGIMILFIIITHFHWEYPRDYLKYGFVFYIDMAVPIFMIITGYFAALSLKRKDIKTLSEAWACNITIPKMIRFVSPLCMALIIETMILGYYVSYFSVVLLFFRGGQGPGAYYTPVLMQLIFLTPIIYFIVKKFEFFGVILCFLITAFYECVQYSWKMSDDVYALVAFRYISLISFGCYIALEKRKLNNIFLLILFVIGIIWQICLNYLPLHPAFMNYPWCRINYLSSVFILPIIYFLINKFKNMEKSITCIQKIGEASYNIYLVQMIVYATFISEKIYTYIDGKFYQLIFLIVLCTTVGYVFYKIEHRITGKILQYIKYKNYYKSFFTNSKNYINKLVS